MTTAVRSRFGRAFLLAALSATPLASHAENPKWAGKLTDGSSPRIAVTPAEGKRFAHLSWPKVAQTKDGTIVLAYIAGTFHGTGGGGSPTVSISTDGGKTFSAPNILQEFGPGKDLTQSGNLALGVAEDGAVVLLAMAFDGDRKNDIFGWRSTDSGKTWTRVDTSALGPNKTGSVFGRIIPVPDVGLVTLGHYRAGSEITRGIWMSVSSDNGKSWGAPVKISNASSVEPALVRTAKGRLIAVLRGTARAGQEYLAVSDDNGKTWNTTLSALAAESGATHGLAAPFIAENPEKPNELIALTTERSKKDGIPGKIWLWRADADKLEWKRDRVLIEFEKGKGIPNDLGYPWMLHREGKKWTMYYYHGLGHGVNYIWAADIEV